MLEFKINIIQELKKKGYNTTRIRKEKLLSESTLTDIRRGKVPAAKLDTICSLLQKQPGSLIKWIPEKDLQPIPENSIDYFFDEYPIE